MLLLQSITPAALGAKQASKSHQDQLGCCNLPMNTHSSAHTISSSFLPSSSKDLLLQIDLQAQQPSSESMHGLKKYRHRQRPPSPLGHVTSWPTQPAFTHS